MQTGPTHLRSDIFWLPLSDSSFFKVAILDFLLGGGISTISQSEASSSLSTFRESKKFHSALAADGNGLTLIICVLLGRNAGALTMGGGGVEGRGGVDNVS